MSRYYLPKLPGPKPNDLIGGVVDAAVEGIGALTSPNCKRWYKDIKNALTNAVNGDDSDCGDIDNNNPHRFPQKCVEEITRKAIGKTSIIIEQHFWLRARELAEKCRSACPGNHQ